MHYCIRILFLTQIFDLEISIAKSRVFQYAFDIFANKNLRPCLESLMME
jgi:hypothetical protein